MLNLFGIRCCKGFQKIRELERGLFFSWWEDHFNLGI